MDLFGDVAGKSIQLATVRHQAGMDMGVWRTLARPAATAAPRVIRWEKVQELSPASNSPGPSLTVAENAPLEIYDLPGAYAQRFDGVAPGGQAKHRSHGRVVWVKTALRQGFPIHGPPACGDPRCIVIAEGWEALFAALKTTRQISIVVEL